jgi:hypothetical protein
MEQESKIIIPCCKPGLSCCEHRLVATGGKSFKGWCHIQMSGLIEVVNIKTCQDWETRDGDFLKEQIKQQRRIIESVCGEE